MDPHRRLAVLDAAQRVADEINQLIDESPGKLLHVNQLRKSSQSIAGNISEGFDRRTLGERLHSLGVARGETGETITHLRPNFRHAPDRRAHLLAAVQSVDDDSQKAVVADVRPRMNPLRRAVREFAPFGSLRS